MSDTVSHTVQRAGFAGGIFTGLLLNITSGDLLKTIVMTAIATAVSFIVTMFLKQFIEQRKK